MQHLADWYPKVVGHLKRGVSVPVLKRAFDYWRNIDEEAGDLNRSRDTWRLI